MNSYGRIRCAGKWVRPGSRASFTLFSQWQQFFRNCSLCTFPLCAQTDHLKIFGEIQGGKNIYMFVWNRHADNNIFGDAQKLLTSTGSLLLFAAGLITFILFILGEYKDGNDDDDDVDGQINTENKIIAIVSQRLICCRVFVSTLLTRLSIVRIQQLANAIYLHKGCYWKCTLSIFIYFLIFLRMCSLSIFVLKNKK